MQKYLTNSRRFIDSANLHHAGPRYLKSTNGTGRWHHSGLDAVLMMRIKPRLRAGRVTSTVACDLQRQPADNLHAQFLPQGLSLTIADSETPEIYNSVVFW